MRCGSCPTTFCQYRKTDGECVVNDCADAMESLEEKIKKATKAWEGVDVERYLDEVRGVDVDLIDAALALVEAVERYVCPKKGQFCHRTELLNKVRKLKELL